MNEDTEPNEGAQAQPLWQTYPAADGQTPKQTALVDAIDALGCLTEPMASLTTAEAAEAVGCSVESAWHALRSLGWVVLHTPPGTGIVVDEDELPLSTRIRCSWSLPEDPYTADDDWYRFRIAAAERLGRADAAEHWRREQDRARP